MRALRPRSGNRRPPARPPANARPARSPAAPLLPLVLLPLVLPLGGCFWGPAMIAPELEVSPYLAVYQLRGDIAMQNDPGTGPVDNAPQSLRQFGFDNYEEDVGVRADFGDGFAGLRLDYYRLDQNTSRTGMLTDDFGALQSGDITRMSAAMDEWRLGWIEEVTSTRLRLRDTPLDLKFGLGVTFAQRDLKMHMQTDDGLRAQDVQMTGGAFYPAARFQAAWRELLFDLDYAISPHLDIGGDYNGVLQDLEARLSYAIPFQDVTVFAGYRYSVLDGDGAAGGLGFDADLRLDGFQFGLQVTF